jgi:hypothetical protein
MGSPHCFPASFVACANGYFANGYFAPLYPSGTMFAWGLNSYGALGLGNSSSGHRVHAVHQFKAGSIANIACGKSLVQLGLASLFTMHVLVLPMMKGEHVTFIVQQCSDDEEGHSSGRSAQAAALHDSTGKSNPKAAEPRSGSSGRAREKQEKARERNLRAATKVGQGMCLTFGSRCMLLCTLVRYCARWFAIVHVGSRFSNKHLISQLSITSMEYG